MKISELRQIKIQELLKIESDLYHEQLNLKMQKAIGQLSKHDQFKKIRRNIARVNIALSELEKKA
jgi:large subunit ribosomal protein L29